MRISDWSSDVCSSDLRGFRVPGAKGGGEGEDILRPGAGAKAAQVRQLDGRAVGYRRGEGHAEFDDVRAPFHQRVEDRGGVVHGRIACGHESEDRKSKRMNYRP